MELKLNTGPSDRCPVCHQSLPTGYYYAEREGVVLELHSRVPGREPTRLHGTVRLHPQCVDLFDPEKSYPA